MLICPKCRTTYSSSLVGVCYRDGEKLVSHDEFVVAEADPLRGRLVAGKYRVADRIGQGGMGTVYRAVQIGLNRHVAVKILKRELAFDPDTVARFQREANALSLLTHPNTVRVYDFGQTEDGLLFLVMELLEGELISNKLNREGVMDVLESVRTTQQILRSLSEAHEHNIVHRDLKPDNILVTRTVGQADSLVKVLDFGIAKIAGPDRAIDQFETQAGTVFGTPRYMSPEQAQGGVLDHRSDLYSVGTLLYLMLTGRAPFVDDDAVVVMAKHIREIPDSPRTAAPDRPIPKSLDDVVTRSLQKDPALRYESARAFEAALEACVPEVLALRTGRGRIMRRLLPIAAAAATATLVVLAYAGYHRATSTAQEHRATPLVVPKPELAIAPTPIVVRENDDEEVLVEGPGPANVAIRSDPEGATVFRDGERLGETPLDLLVQPDQELVRVELRKPGFQPLAAELTARDGERLLTLAKEQAASPPPRPAPLPRHNTRATQGSARKGQPARTTSEAKEAPSSEPSAAGSPGATPATPYERFE